MENIEKTNINIFVNQITRNFVTVNRDIFAMGENPVFGQNMIET